MYKVMNCQSRTGRPSRCFNTALEAGMYAARMERRTGRTYRVEVR